MYYYVLSLIYNLFVGKVISSAYILYLQKNGMVRSFKLIRGNYGTQPIPVNTTLDTYQINGPPIRYNCRFGTAVTSLGDVNFDGVPDIAVVRLKN